MEERGMNLLNNDSNINPYSGIFNAIQLILTDNMIIKYNYKAEEYETMETKGSADMYLSALDEMDNFYSYNDYTREELYLAGITDSILIDRILSRNDWSLVPRQFRDALVKLRREKIINEYEEANDYYRMLNGLPPIETQSFNFHYIDNETALRYEIDRRIPIHQIQDYYNEVEPLKGDYFINILEGLGIITQLQKDYPDEEYLKFIGSKRISIQTARKAKNFEIIRINQGNIRAIVYDSFLTLYTQARDYFISVVYTPYFRNYIEYYDNFIAMNIMLMTIHQLLSRQLEYSIDREYYSVYGLQMLYQAYNVPYNLNLDYDRQRGIAQSLNLLIQNKATDKVFFDISQLLGYDSIKIYKYYLIKDKKYDQYGTPVIKYKDVFNIDTGEMERVPDYDAMYDLYFQKVEYDKEGVLPSLKDNTLRDEYDKITSEDPYWWEDGATYNEVWSAPYNYIESKYIGVGVSYKLTEIMYESILLLKLLMDKDSELGSIKFTIPKILDGSSKISLFDATILLCCLTSKKHHVKGEIISIPSQVIHVLDYFRNEDYGYNGTVDAMGFDFSYFTEDVEEIYNNWIQENNSNISIDEFIDAIDNGDIVLNIDSTNTITKLINLLGKEESIEFIKYMKVLYIDSQAEDYQKITALNGMYSNIKNLSQFIQYQMSITHDRELYETLKIFYNAVFFSRENKQLFSIIIGQDEAYVDSTGGYYVKASNRTVYYDKDGNLVDNNIPFDILESEIQNGYVTKETISRKRCAKNYFEFLYWHNPKLYSAIFDIQMYEQYEEYVAKNELFNYSFEDFRNDVYLGVVDIEYDRMNTDSTETEIKEEMIYFYIDHIISRMEDIIKGLKFIYLINDAASPIEELLLRMIRFFKSYTVDFAGLDVAFVCDLKAENIIRLFDEVAYIDKLIQIDTESIHITYSDVIGGMESTITTKDTSLSMVRDDVVAIWQE